MGKIIALQGAGSSGKTTTIRLLPDILKKNGYSQVPGALINHGKKDFSDIFVNGTKKVGITSQGDNHKTVHDKLTRLVNAGCDVCVCACRTQDRNPPGSIAAVHSFPSHKPQFVKKTTTKNASQYLAVDKQDANIIFLLI